MAANIPNPALVDSLVTWAKQGAAAMSRAQLQQLLADLDAARSQLEADIVAKRAMELLASWRAGAQLSAEERAELATALDTVKSQL